MRINHLRCSFSEDHLLFAGSSGHGFRPLPCYFSPQRLRRRAFYQRAGFVPSGVGYRWQGESYELMVFGGALDEAAFLAFWRHFGVTPKTGGAF